MTQISVEQDAVEALLAKYRSFIDDVDAALAAFPGVVDGGLASEKIGIIAEAVVRLGKLAMVAEEALCQVTSEVVEALLDEDQDAADVFAGLEGYGLL
ncbi:hypothetical protein [Leucobacter chromiiresistens]|uniref:Uncharacterized protein n=1 Tax=Leucobacter chromiiresistens TaxID=1079994 RepID=A0A147EMM0_9MICO|nr:hypothetical protein [Leucobacter chromiiresistens]KTR85575.1 hypothetical protein NS354_08635 [Leucobacter chromiiresistens]